MANGWARIVNIRPGKDLTARQVQYDSDTNKINTDFYGYNNYDHSLGMTEDQLMNKIFKHKESQGSGFLPAAIRYYNSGEGFMLFETPPSHKTISISHVAKGSVNQGNTHKYTIPFPWIVYAICMNSNYQCTQLRIAYRNAPLQAAGNDFYYPLLPNVFEDLTICMPGRFYERNHDSVPDLIEDLLKSYWSSSFNRDLNINDCAISYLNNNNSLAINQENIWDQMSMMTLEDVLRLKMLQYEGRFAQGLGQNNPLMLAMYG